MTHTPGPWEHSAYEGGWDCIRDSNGQIIAKLGLNEPANATLIASAPDLLEALKNVVFHFDGEAEDMYEARAAIARATGEADA